MGVYAAAENRAPTAEGQQQAALLVERASATIGKLLWSPAGSGHSAAVATVRCFGVQLQSVMRNELLF